MLKGTNVYVILQLHCQIFNHDWTASVPITSLKSNRSPINILLNVNFKQYTVVCSKHYTKHYVNKNHRVLMFIKLNKRTSSFLLQNQQSHVSHCYSVTNQMF